MELTNDDDDDDDDDGAFFSQQSNKSETNRIRMNTNVEATKKSSLLSINWNY